MPAHYICDSTQMLLDVPFLRDAYIEKLRQILDRLTPNQPFPNIVYLPEYEHQASFASVLMAMDDHVSMRTMLETKVRHMSKRFNLHEGAKLWAHVFQSIEKSLAHTHGQASVRAHARVAVLKEELIAHGTERWMESPIPHGPLISMN